jgi:hypothetical protein
MPYCEAFDHRSQFILQSLLEHQRPSTWPVRAKCSILQIIAAYHEIKDRICDHDGVGREMANSILDPPFDSLRAESN